MKATDTLKEEHRLIERVLVILEKAAKSAAQNKPVRPEFFLKACDFNENFTEACHHKKEEEILFKFLAENGVPIDGGLLGTLRTEHDQGREYIRNMHAAAEAWAAGDQEGRAEVIWITSSYTTLLRQQLQKENSILFALAEQTIPTEEQGQVGEAFDRTETETNAAALRDKYAAIVESLEQEAASWK